MSRLSAHLDRIVDRLERVGLAPEVTLPLEELAALVSAAGDRNDATVVTIPLPSNIAKRFPDAGQWNHGHEAHATVCFITADKVERGFESTILQAVRHACRKVGPFHLRLDVGAGLKSFGKTDSGEQALWFGAVSDPRGELERLHRVVRMTLADEGVEAQHQGTFVPHVTWAYVRDAEAEVTSSEFQRWNSSAAGSFIDGKTSWFVDSVEVSTPFGQHRVLLNPARPPRLNFAHVGVPRR